MMGCWIASLYGACFWLQIPFPALVSMTRQQQRTAGQLGHLLTPCGGMRCALPPAPPSSFLFSCPSLLISTSSPAKCHTTTRAGQTPYLTLRLQRIRKIRAAAKLLTFRNPETTRCKYLSIRSSDNTSQQALKHCYPFLFSCPSLLISTSSPAQHHTTTSFSISNGL